MTVTPPEYLDGVAENPWRLLRSRPHLTLEWAWLHDCKGRITDHGAFRLVELDCRLSQVERNSVLMHELVHDEYDLFFASDAPPALVVTAERFVRRVTAERLVPSDELAAFVDRTAWRGVTVYDVAEQFGVTEDVAAEAVRLHGERARRTA